jgi:hypothetical protein
MLLGSANRSLHSGKAQSKTAPDKLPKISLAVWWGIRTPGSTTCLWNNKLPMKMDVKNIIEH